MFASIVDDFKAYKRPLTKQGFWALLFHRYGMAVKKISHFPIAYIPLRIIHHVLIKFSEIFFGIYIGPDAQIGRRLIIEHFGCIIINSRAVIGDDVRIRHEVTIGNKRAEMSDEVPRIGNRVDIGAGAKILGSITIGNDVQIGANSVVLRDIPDNYTAVGVPARMWPRTA